MKLSIYTGGMVQTNGYLVETAEGNFLVDAPAGVADWVAGKGVRVDEVLLTHQHYDHVEDAAALRAGGAKLWAFAGYSTELTLEAAARGWGMPISVTPYEIDVVFEMGGAPEDRNGTANPLLVCGVEILLAHVPGHSTDSVTFYLRKEGILFSGDTLFAGSVGRADLPGGDMVLLVEGILEKLLTLPEETKVFPGHGPGTTVGREKRGNPFLI